ncbi:MAG: ABC transporter ATP-binding protein [Chloroflexota bacterium]
MTQVTQGAPDVVLDRVAKVFGDGTVAVDDFSLSVAKGEFVAFLGPSGCGKTTTLKMIGGFEEPTRGDILIAGQRVNGVPPERRSTGMVFQSYALFPHMNVAENVGYGLKLRGDDKATRKQKVGRILELMGLDDVAARKVDQLSGGQRQRVAVARSVVVEPDVLLLDEPLGALDANLRARMQSELKRIQKQLGITFIFVTHAQSEAMAMADTIVVMNNGRIEQIGRPAEIFTRPATRFTAQFIGNNNLIDGTVGGAVLDGPLGRFPVAPGAPGGPASLVVRADRMRFDHPSLGDRYDSAIEGTLIGEELVGSVVTFSVQVAPDRIFRIEQHETMSGHGHVPTLNERVRLRWPSAESLVLAG